MIGLEGYKNCIFEDKGICYTNDCLSPERECHAIVRDSKGKIIKINYYPSKEKLAKILK